MELKLGTGVLFMKIRLRLYLFAVSLAAVLAVAATSLILHRDGSAYLSAALYLASFGAVAELLTYQMPQGGSGSVALIPYLSVALLVPDWRAPLAVGVA